MKKLINREGYMIPLDFAKDKVWEKQYIITSTKQPIKKFKEVIKTYKIRSKVGTLEFVGLKMLALKKGRRVIKYKLGTDTHSLRNQIKEIKWVPKNHKVELDWANELVRITGKKADNQWHEINLHDLKIRKNKIDKIRINKLNQYRKNLKKAKK